MDKDIPKDGPNWSQLYTVTMENASAPPLEGDDE
jgi:hypothetical protein